MKKIVLIGLLSISWIVAAGEDVPYGDRSLFCTQGASIRFTETVDSDGSRTYSVEAHPEVVITLAKLFDRTEKWENFLKVINFSIFPNPALILTPEQEALGYRRSIIVPENVALAVSLAPNTVSNFKKYVVFLYHAGFKQGLNIGQKTMREAKDREIARLQAEHAKELEALRNQASGVGFVIKFPHQPESFNGANALQEIISFDEELPSQDVLSRLLQARIEMDKGITVTETPLGDGGFNISTKYSFSNQSLSNIQYLLRGNLLQQLKNFFKKGCEPNPDSSGGNGGGGAAKDDSDSSPTPSAQLVSTENSTGNRRFPTGLMSLLGGC